jgi:hypothetical protein
MEPHDNSLAIEDPLATFLDQHDSFNIYTHSARTRITILMLFLSYLVFFTLFLRSILKRLQDLESLPAVFANLEGAQLNHWLFYTIAVVSLLVAVFFLFYFLWAVVDIWGLQIWCSNRELRVQNTITGLIFARWMGVGTIAMEHIDAIRGAKFMTYVYDKAGNRVRFTPVYKVDTLIATILSQAKDAKVVD